MSTPMYDVVVVGARVAGSATAMLLARRGLRVLVLDRARFPSDTLSSHQVQVRGGALLRRWGLLNGLVASGATPAASARFDVDGVRLEGRFPETDGVDGVHSPRRTVLDATLVEAARAAGAEVREDVTVEALVTDPTGRVTGVRGRVRRGRSFTESARVVVGADGKHSTVARQAGAPPYRSSPPRTFASYAYWSGVEVGAAELYLRPGLAVAVFPTNDQHTVVYLAQPVGTLPAYRRDVAAGYLAALDRCGDLGERVRAATRVERVRTTPDLPQRATRPFGPGWALVGDAGLVIDPVTAHGITHALQDADRLAGALADGLQDGHLGPRLARAWWARERATRSVVATTTRLARLDPLGAGQRALLEEVATRPADVTAFLAAFAGLRRWETALAPAATRLVTRSAAGSALRARRTFQSKAAVGGRWS